MLLDLQRPVEWLFLGDSTCNQGVRPDVWNRMNDSTTSSLNLCTMADMLAVGDSWMLQTYLRSHGRPEGGVVIVHAYDMWPRGSDSYEALLAHIPLSWGFWRRLQPPVVLSTKTMVKVALAKFAPIYSENQSIKDAISNPASLLGEQFQLDEYGFMPRDEPSVVNVRVDAAEHLKLPRGSTITISDENRNALLRLRALAQDWRVHIYIAGSPVFEGLLTDPALRRYITQMNAAICDVIRPSAYVHCLFDEAVTFRAEEMQNADHVTTAAAAVYTRRLAAAVRAVQLTRRPSQQQRVDWRPPVTVPRFSSQR
jgi:hypothetical protein